MSPEQIASRLGLGLELHGDCGAYRLLGADKTPLFVLSPRGVVGGGRRYAVTAVLDLAALMGKREEAA